MANIGCNSSITHAVAHSVGQGQVGTLGYLRAECIESVLEEAVLKGEVRVTISVRASVGFRVSASASDGLGRALGVVSRSPESVQEVS